MDLDKLAIDVILTEGKLEPFVSAGLTVEDFQGPMKEVAAFIWDYWANPKFKGKLPTESIIRRKHASYALEHHKEQPEWVIDELRRRTRYNRVSSIMAAMGAAMKKNDVDEASDLLAKGGLEMAALRASTQMRDVTRNMAERKFRYEQRRDKINLYGTPSGFPWFDKWTLGIQPGDLGYILGKRGTGKCVAVDEWIPLADGSRKLAGDLVGQFFEIPTLKDGKLGKAEAHAEFNRIETCYEITTESGRKVVRNGEHLLWAAMRVFRTRSTSGEIFQLGWRHAWEIRPGMLLAVTDSLPAGSGDISEDAVKLLAYMIGDGCTRGGDMRFTQQNNDQLAEFFGAIGRIGGSLTPSKTRPYDWSVSFGLKGKGNGNPFIGLMKKYGLHNKLSVEKRIPEEVFSLRPELLRVFVSRLFSTDGWASVNTDSGRGEIGYSSSSTGLIHDLQHLLLRLGISSQVRFRKKVRSWSLTVRTDCIRRFCTDVGIYGKEKAVFAVLEARDRAEDQSKPEYLRGRVCKWRKENARPNTSWEKVKSVKTLYGVPTVAISVPETQCFFTEFLEHNTWMLLMMAHAAQLSGERVMLVSREMDVLALENRYDALHAKLPYQAFRRGELGHQLEKQYYQALSEMEGMASLYFPKFEGPCTPMAIQALARQAGVTWIGIDGVYLLDNDAGEKGWEGRLAVARGLKEMCNSDRVKCVINNQLNRDEDPRNATLDNAAYSDAYSQFADWALKLVQGSDERINKEMLAQFLKMREEDLPTYPVRIKWDLEGMEFDSLEDEESGGYSAGIDPEEMRY